MDTIKNYLLKSFKVNNSISNPAISGMSATAVSLFCVAVFEQMLTDSNLLYIADDTVDISYIKPEIEFFLENKSNVEVLILPLKNSTNRSFFFEKLLEKDTRKIVIVNNSMLLDAAVSKTRLSEDAFSIAPKAVYSRSDLIKLFINYGFSREDEVYEKGDFSVRGEIVDLWPLDAKHPYRLVFDDDEIEAIYTFDISTQRRKEKVDVLNIRNLLEDDTGCIVMDYFQDMEYFYIYGKSYTHNTIHLLKNYRAAIIEPFTQTGIYDAKIYPMHNFQGVFELFIKQLKEFADGKYSIKIVLHKKSEITNLKASIKSRLPDIEIEFLIGNLREGFFSHEQRLAMFTEKDIFGREIVLESEVDTNVVDVFSDSMIDYKTGDLVVHSRYGIGKFLGFNKVQTEDKVSEYITIEYSKNDKLYVPIYDFNLIHKYASSDAAYNIKLDNLDGASWSKTKNRVQQRIFEMANEIIAIQAKRKKIKGTVFEESDEYERDFAAGFPYEETGDQKRVIEEILFDMKQPEPMERLVCGDVGYGKTEVAMRAIFRAVINAAQVIFIAPTTILAKQHFNTLKERFFNYPVNIEILSRFSSVKKRNQVKENIKNGKIDVLISTHSVLRSSLDFVNLGLVIIDEEHRFGVKDKERLKRLNKNIDILYLSATPIPRTLSMALNGVKDISVIETPPPNRKEISTYIGKYDNVIIRDAINFELARDGQVFYIYNRIEDIELKYQEIVNIAPHAKVAIAHGQMLNTKLDTVMTKFFNKEIDILLATTIVESGLDIPTMNMMIVDGAERLGLAQLYQLRGRVGRGWEKAFCYLFYPENVTLNENAVKRLQAVQNFQGFGAGFKLALRDLEIRGSGNILGKKQHGYIREVGFELYMEMLNCAIENMGDGSSLKVNPEINLNINAYIPEKYIENVAIRLSFYKRMLNIATDKELQEINLEMVDRFGKIPLVLSNFFMLTSLRILSKELALKSINETRNKITVEFFDIEAINIDKLLDLSKKYDKNIRFKIDKLNVFEIIDFPEKKDKKLIFIKKILQHMA